MIAVHRLIALSVLLGIFIGLPVAARELRMQSPNGEGGVCPDAAAAEDAELAPAKPGAKRAAPASKPKAQNAYRGSDNSPVRAPRWHRFLPGMYR